MCNYYCNGFLVATFIKLCGIQRATWWVCVYSECNNGIYTQTGIHDAQVFKTTTQLHTLQPYSTQ